MAPDCIGDEVQAMVNNLQSGQVRMQQQLLSSVKAQRQSLASWRALLLILDAEVYVFCVGAVAGKCPLSQAGGEERPRVCQKGAAPVMDYSHSHTPVCIVYGQYRTPPPPPTPPPPC